MDGRMERGRGGYKGGGVGGQRLKLHHKSNPERKHEVTPPRPFPSTSLPLRPSPLLSPPLRLPPFPLFLCTESAPWMDQVYFILVLHVLQTPNSPISPQSPPLFIYLPFASLLLPACCKAINHTADLIGKGEEKNTGGEDG